MRFSNKTRFLIFAIVILFSVIFGYLAYNEKPSKCTMIGISFIVIGLLFIHVVSKMNIIK